jgi:hypothetical protein
VQFDVSPWAVQPGKYYATSDGEKVPGIQFRQIPRRHDAEIEADGLDRLPGFHSPGFVVAFAKFEMMLGPQYAVGQHHTDHGAILKIQVGATGKKQT